MIETAPPKFISITFSCLYSQSACRDAGTTEILICINRKQSAEGGYSHTILEAAYEVPTNADIIFIPIAAGLGAMKEGIQYFADCLSLWPVEVYTWSFLALS